MKNFFFGFSVIFFINQMAEVFFLNNLLSRASPYKELDARIIIYYIIALSTYSYYNIAILCYTKDLTGIVSFVLTRIELVIFRVVFHLQYHDGYKIIYLLLLNLTIYIYLYIKWDALKAFILRSYSRKIGADTSVRKVYVLRCFYGAFQNFTFIIYVNMLFFRSQNFRFPLSTSLILYFTTLPIFMAKVVKRFETEKEDTDAKVIAFCSYIIADILLSVALVLDIISPKTLSSTNFIMIFNLVHFFILTILCLVDYSLYGKGLKEAFLSTKSKRKL